MQSTSFLFAGADISSGRKPVTLAALDEDRNITLLEKFDVTDAISRLREYRKACLVISKPSTPSAQKAYNDFKSQVALAGFESFSRKENAKQSFETNTQACYRDWIGQDPLPRRTLEGRLQRALILYEHGLRIEDPMEIFEEITRYKLVRGTFRLENIYSSKELDALLAAYLAWMSVNRPERIVAKDEFVLPAQE
jgi:hypothetical protein